jgi:hypothetical protein
MLRVTNCGTDYMHRIRWKKRIARSARRFSREQLRALRILAGVPRGIGEEILVVAHGFSVGMLSGLVLAELAMVVTETKMAPRGPTTKVERIRITDNGRRVLEA